MMSYKWTLVCKHYSMLQNSRKRNKFLPKKSKNSNNKENKNKQQQQKPPHSPTSDHLDLSNTLISIHRPREWKPITQTVVALNIRFIFQYLLFLSTTWKPICLTYDSFCNKKIPWPKATWGQGERKGYSWIVMSLHVKLIKSKLS